MQIPPFYRWLALACGLLLTACGPDYSFRETRELPPAGWAYADSLRYAFRIDDSTQVYDLHLLVDHTEALPFQNVYVRLTTVFPGGERRTEVVSLQLAENTGTWLGDCRGEACTLDIPIQQGAYFSQVGPYELTLTQYTRRDTLPGVRALTFALQPTERR